MKIDRRVALREPDAIHRAMSAEILRLERHIEGVERGQPRLLVASYMILAVRLRDQLASISRRDVMLEAMPSFGQLLAEATAGAYRWAVGQLWEVRHLVSGQGRCSSIFSRSMRQEDLSVFHELGRLCTRFGGVSTQQLVKTLDAIDDTLYRVIETRDCIEHVVCGSR